MKFTFVSHLRKKVNTQNRSTAARHSKLRYCRSKFWWLRSCTPAINDCEYYCTLYTEVQRKFKLRASGGEAFQRRITGTFLKLLTIHWSGINQHSDVISCAPIVTARFHTKTLIVHVITTRPYHFYPVRCCCDARPKLDDLWQNL